MSSKRNHRIRSRKTYAARIQAARNYLNAYHPKARASGRDMSAIPDKK